MISSGRRSRTCHLPIFFSLVVLPAGALRPARSELNESEFYGPYDEVLTSFVDARGCVDYAGLRKDRQGLDEFIQRLRNISVAPWSASTQIAFWINVYNALTLRVIVDNYPIRSSFLTSLAYPKNSIRQIDGVWDEIRFRVAGRDLSLNEIEHSILRKQFDEPRIHVALVCAAEGCPPLRREAYSGERLESQLQDQAARFLGDPSKVRVEEGRGLVFLSSIFSWFGGDFEDKYLPPKDAFPGRSSAQRAVLSFVFPFLTDRERAYLSTGSFRIKYLSYDWTLNQQ